MWGNAYPRPSVEMIEKSWKLSLGQLTQGVCGIRIEADPDLDFSTYPRALYKWEKIHKAGWVGHHRTAEAAKNIEAVISAKKIVSFWGFFVR